VIKCPGCGEENPPKFKLCGYCGTPLHAAAPPALPAHEIRKTVTLLFTDLKDSTALGERLDSEALHEVKERYFNAMAAEIRRHGGKIEKYIGDAIMAVFGLPRAHEDDALRAVRAAVGMKEALQQVNSDLGRRYGVRLANRTGVNTGEVVASDDPTADQKLATGDAVNVTARLEAAAPANEIYIGETTWRLVRDAVEAEPVEPLALKGKSEPVPAFRVVRAHGQDGNVRRHDTPVVGREAELATLLAAWEAAISQRRAQLVTVVGDAGVGKTRLVREAIDRLGTAARVVSGRCLPYGDGITFWPLREMVVSAAGIGQNDTPEVARERLLDCVRDADVAERLASAAGLGSTQFPLHEINWAARKFLQTLAGDGPVLAMFDDIHWAEPAFLDLIENMLDTVEDAPVLLLATARHDLIEEKPDWGRRERASRLELQPLGVAAVAQVVANVLGTTGLGDDLIARIVAAAEGNPLYVEQMLSMLKDSGALRQDETGGWVVADTAAGISVPPTIQALLEARLDRLERTERATAEPAAVIGVEFARPAVASLAPAPVKDNIDTHLEALSRKQFIRPTRSVTVEQAYRFHHHLVREAVYNGLLKRARASFHVEFVRWADRVNAEADRGQEFEAILGYHLEQAYRYLGELGPHDEAGVELGRDAARRLASAGRRALGRGDMHAASNLLGRAVALLSNEDPGRVEMLPAFAETLIGVGDFARARPVLREARSLADRIGRPRIKAASQLVEMLLRLHGGGKRDPDEEALPAAPELIPLLEREDAHSDLATAWRLIAHVHGMAGRYRMASEAAERSISHARTAGNEALVAKVAYILADTALLGSTPVRQAIRQCEQLIAEGLKNREVECRVMRRLAQLRAMNGELETARALYRQSRAVLHDLGQEVSAASSGIDVALVELLGGDLALAEREVRSDLDFLAKAGSSYYLSTMTALLSRLVRDLGRDDEALQLSTDAEKAADEDDFDSQALWRAIRAPIIARAGDLLGAEALARTAVELVRRTEAPMMQADALAELAEVLKIAGRPDEARAAIAEAIALYGAKGNVVLEAQCRRWASGLDAV
jgi:class 3 adenylate cyclase/tetratricopeptide (TPR) repeat protein